MDMLNVEIKARAVAAWPSQYAFANNTCPTSNERTLANAFETTLLCVLHKTSNLHTTAQTMRHKQPVFQL
jgi:hypothetical protein